MGAARKPACGRFLNQSAKTKTEVCMHFKGFFDPDPVSFS